MIRIPAIDLINGTCVRLTKGEFDQTTKYNLDPVEIAKKYERAGAKNLHIVDLDAARGSGENTRIIQQVLQETNLKIQIGGGIKTEEQVAAWLEKGISAVIIGSAALSRREEVKRWIKKYGSERIIIGADVRNHKIAVDGWMSTSDENITDFMIEYIQAGARTFLCTDIQKDGTLSGTSNTLYRMLIAKFPTINLIASGGVANVENLHTLEEMNVYACVIGKALFEQRIDLKTLF